MESNQHPQRPGSWLKTRVYTVDVRCVFVGQLAVLVKPCYILLAVEFWLGGFLRPGSLCSNSDKNLHPTAVLCLLQTSGTTRTTPTALPAWRTQQQVTSTHKHKATRQTTVSTCAKPSPLAYQTSNQSSLGRATHGARQKLALSSRVLVRAHPTRPRPLCYCCCRCWLCCYCCCWLLPLLQLLLLLLPQRSRVRSPGRWHGLLLLWRQLVGRRPASVAATGCKLSSLLWCWPCHVLWTLPLLLLVLRHLRLVLLLC